jgi:hypothetical protein
LGGESVRKAKREYRCRIVVEDEAAQDRFGRPLRHECFVTVRARNASAVERRIRSRFPDSRWGILSLDIW